MAQTKRPRTVQAKNTTTFHSADQLIESFGTRNPEALKNALVSFRNQITVTYDERPSVGDARLALVTAWLAKSSGASELFDIWDTGSNFTSLVLVSLAHVLSLLAGTPGAVIHAPAILRVLFDSAHARRLNAHLASGQTDVVLAALKVLNAAALIDQRTTFEAVAWTAKVDLCFPFLTLPKLFSHRHRTPTSQPLAHPSIRTALTTLLLTLLPLSLSLDIFTTLFKGLAQDDGVLVKIILETCWEKIWCDVKVSKSVKVKVFGGLGMFMMINRFIRQIQPLYSRTDPDSTEPLAPADIAHHFLLALCTNPGSGLCFRSKGWYPRPSGNPFEESAHRGEDEVDEESKPGTLYNPLLLKLLRLLRPATDARQFELAVRILVNLKIYRDAGAAQIGLSLEPRLSTRWITSVGFMSAVIGTDVPVESFYLEAPAHSTSTRVHRAEPPPLNAIVENIVASLLTKSAPSSADTSAQPSSGGLVQHTTIRLLTQCLLKLSTVLESFPSGWATRATEVVDAVRRRIPEVGVVVGVAQEAVKALVEGEGERTEARRDLLAEGALRLLWLYARVLPGAIAEVRFDVGKLLQETEVGEGEDGERNGMRVMCQIHVLRVLGESDQFVWSAKPAGSTHTHMYRLISLHLRTLHPQLREASSALVVRLLSSSVLFEHDPREAKAWVDALPRNLEDVTVFLEFFDDVLSRCIKTPYRYLEAGNQLYGRSAINMNVSRMPSPLLMAVLEQLKNKPMDPPARRVIAVFMARLLRAMVGKMDVESAKAVVGYMRGVFEREGGGSGGMRVIEILDAFFGTLELEESGQMDVDDISAAGITSVVDEMEAMAVGEDEAAKSQAALGILQWFKTSEGRVGAPEVARLIQLLASWSTDGVVLGEFLEELDMRVHSGAVLGSGEGAVSAAISLPLAFWVFLRQGSGSVPAKQQLAESLLRQPTQHLGAAVRASTKSAISDCLVALELVARRASSVSEVVELKQVIFGELEVVKSLMFEPAWASHIASIISSVLSSSDEEDCALAAPYSQYWSKRLLESKGGKEFEECAAGFTIWIPFTPGQVCAQIFRSSLELVENWASVSTTTGSLLEQLAMRLRSSTLSKDSATQLAETLPRLIKVPPVPEYRNLLKLAPTIAERELPLGLNLGLLQPSDSLAHVTEEARIRWTSKTGALRSISWQDFSGWIETPELVRLSTALMYLSANTRAAFSNWVGQQSSLPARAIGPCFAFMDCHAALARTLPDQILVPQTTVDIIVDCAARILFKHGERPEYQRWAAQTLINVVRTLPGDIDRVARSTLKRFPANPRDAVQQHILLFVSWAAPYSSYWEELVDLVVDSALLWLVRRFAEDESDSPELLATLPGFESLLAHASNIKAHLAEPVLTAAIKNRLDVPAVIKLCSKLAGHTPLKILSIFHLFEKSRHMSTMAILRNWTPEISPAQPKDLLSAVCNFDPVLMFRTCTSFPQRRDPGTMELPKAERKGDIYDPNFALPLLAALMVSDEPVTSMQWVGLCRTNVLSLALSSLSSKRPTMRQLGYAALTTAYARLMDVDFQERAQLMYTLNLLRDLLPQPSATPSDPIPRLPTHTTLLLSHAIRDIFVPATPLYPLISRFLLQRPEFDPRDVPMLYTLLYSSSGEWRRERSWVLRFLADGMRSTEDWKVLKRRHTWDLLASLFQSVAEDRTLRLSILEVLVNASANKHAATSLLLNSSILSWVYMQLGSILTGEPLAYLKIIENLSIVVDHDQIEKATAGHWRDTIAQIVCKIIQGH
ncbi:hypothetical protein FRC10_010167, partial [Ceratobasidium sp. 414]